ncbi:MAG: hypothetical protein M0R80_25375 [Proteobacteria bacterium]|jgi:hypothetical protein|nr:hypothetical protein [Pseudomonadota bacterium]
MWRAVCPLLIVFLAASPAGAAKTDIVVKDTLKLTVLKATAELPQEVEGAVRAGATEEEIGKSLRKMKEDKAEPEAAVEVARHFRKQAQERTRDHGLSDVVHACLAQGKRGTELVACVHEDWEKKPKVRKGGEGKPDEAGKPDDKGKPDEAGKPDDKGKPDEAGKPDDKGKPDEAGKPDDKGKIEDKGQPEGKGQPGGKGKQEGKGGH